MYMTVCSIKIMSSFAKCMHVLSKVERNIFYKSYCPESKVCILHALKKKQLCIQKDILPDKTLTICTTIWYSNECPASILYKSIGGRYRPVSYSDGPITARYRFIKNAYWVRIAFCHMMYICFPLCQKQQTHLYSSLFCLLSAVI